MAEPRQCDACPAMLTFVQSFETNRWLPLELLDEVPDDRLDRVRSYYSVEEHPDGVTYASKLDDDDVDLHDVVYVSHFETCPKAGQFTRRRK